ncbi:MAG: tetratricopeptide repeat protein [Acidobacteria bacterium]|nr:tetratricopeptide repeat protein [Acidobacteriota bacterium]
MENYKANKTGKLYNLLLTICLVTSLAIVEVTAQSSNTQNTSSSNSDKKQTLLQTANQHFQKQDWQASIETYLSITNIDSKDGRVWYRLGFSYHALGKYEKAIEAYTRAVEINNNPVAMYNLACSYAQLGNKTKAIEWLESSVEKGFNQLNQLKNDKNFISLHSETRFTEVVKKVEKASYPCLYSLEARLFDFWVGEWDVKTQDGSLAGTNTIQRVVGDCALIENWTNSSGGTGKSFNFYNNQTKKWHQTWVDDKGNVINFSGEFKDNSMKFQAENTTSDGKKILRKLTFYPISSDQVRQLGEISSDNGNSWAIEYDLTYFRRK